MKKFIAVFEVPDGYKPTYYLLNADGWFTDEEGNRCTVGTKLEEAKQGEWITCNSLTSDNELLDENEYYLCPFCHSKFRRKHDFCVCGADMRKGDET